MPIPDLEHGLLPTGIHRCSMDEIAMVFGTGNPSQKRQDLWDGCQAFLNMVSEQDAFESAYIDGSYTTDKDFPSDVDVVLATSLGKRGLGRKLKSWPPEAQRLIIDGAHVKSQFGVHFFLLHSDIPRGTRFDMRDYFQRVKPAEAQVRSLPPSHRKGILKVEL